MRVEWNERKNLANRKKHGVSFELAQHVFDDPFHVSVQDRHVEGEERWQTLGLVSEVLVLLVAHTYGNEEIRIISARKATRKERDFYEKTR